MNLCDNILQYRMEHNYSIREFAKLCGLSHVQLYFMERGLNSDGKPFTPTPSVKAKFYELVSSRVNSREEGENGEKAKYILRQRISKLIDSLQYAETQEDTKAIMEKVNELRRQMPVTKPRQTVSKDDCDKFVEMFCDIESMDMEQKKIILRRTVDQIVVKPDDISLFMTVKRGVVIAINKQ